MSLSPSPAPTIGTRPEQGKFTKIQKAFLNRHLPDYFAFDNKKKGAKKEWVLSNVYPLYVEEFNSDGPSGVNLSSLETKIARHFFNAKPQDAVKLIKPAKEPRVTNAQKLFAKANQSQLSMTLKSELSERGLTPTEGNLKLSREIKKAAYERLSDVEKAEYEAQAAEYNTKIKHLPPVEHIFENQNAITQTVGAALESLRGYNWNQLGNVAFFVQVAYINSEDRLKTCTVGVADRPPGVPMSIDVHPHFDDTRKAFKGWAGRVLNQDQSQAQSSGTTLIVSGITSNEEMNKVTSDGMTSNADPLVHLSNNRIDPAASDMADTAMAIDSISDSEPNVVTSDGMASDALSPISINSEPNAVVSNRTAFNTFSDMELNAAGTDTEIVIHGNSEPDGRSNLLDDNDKVGKANTDQLVKEDQDRGRKRKNTEDECEILLKKSTTVSSNNETVELSNVRSEMPSVMGPTRVSTRTRKEIVKEFPDQLKQMKGKGKKSKSKKA